MIMSRMTLGLCTVLFVFTAHAGADQEDLMGGKGPIALVYKGPGSCDGGDNCSGAAATVARKAGFRVKYVTPDEISPAVFDQAVLWVQPGGNAITVVETVGQKKLSHIREFVRGGGAYVGFCAGAFLADKTVDNPETIPGLGIIPVGTFDYDLDDRGGLGNLTWIIWKGVRRHIYFNGGGSFYVNPKTRNVKVFARFQADDLPAAISTTFGRGRVVVTGAHPEAFQFWKTDGNLNDEDGEDHDLAEEMMLNATGGQPQ
jgi:glutamine amidotransferase-like uncharacterized protein